MQSLLVTDIVGSTRLWAEHESAMAGDLGTHDELVTGAIEAAGGRVFKHTGDGMMATFESAGASAAAAADIQRRIGAAEWRVPGGIRVRAGLHSGSVHERHGDLFGPPVNRLARLLARCPPEAVLVSEATAALLGDGMPDGLALRELGRIELKDVGRTEAVHCLVGDGLAAVDGADVIGSAGARGGVLPPVDAELVGRSAEIAAVLDALEAHAVVTIVGVGGMGKTRLALETAAAADVADGSWWCDLTAATSPDAVPAAVLASLGVSQAAGRTATESIVDHLATQRALVVFDNCEHVVEAARDLVSAIRVGAGATRVLATSREAIGLRGEHVVPLSSLPGPDAIGLFCTRAVEARPDLDLDDATLGAVEEICVSLDGIPLAIELAAARCRSMAPTEIAARLDDRFKLLRGGRGGVERHRTLLATVEWSYSQLDPEERQLFDRLSVFVGGALIDAVAEVCDLDEYDALDVLDRLIARSMVVAVDTPLGTRYRQLETLRQYAEDQLVVAGVVDEVRDRHLAWAEHPQLPYLSVYSTSAEADSFRRFVAEMDNLRAAARYATATDRPLPAARVIAGGGYWWFFRPAFEVADWIDPRDIAAEEWDDDVLVAVSCQILSAIFAGRASRAVELLDAIPAPWVDLPWGVQTRCYAALWATGDLDLAEACTDRLDATNDRDALQFGFARGQVMQTRMHTDRAGDAGYLERALDLTREMVDQARTAGAEIGLSTALLIRGYVLEGAGDLTGALEVQTDAASVGERLGSGLTVDAARAGLVEVVTRLAVLGGRDLAESARAVRTALADGIARRSVVFVLGFLGGGIERLLWAAGDQHTAAVLGRYARLHATTYLGETVVDPEAMGADELAAIDAEAARLDFDEAGVIALAALDRVIAAA